MLREECAKRLIQQRSVVTSGSQSSGFFEKPFIHCCTNPDSCHATNMPQIAHRCNRIDSTARRAHPHPRSATLSGHRAEPRGAVIAYAPKCAFSLHNCCSVALLHCVDESDLVEVGGAEVDCLCQVAFGLLGIASPDSPFLVPPVRIEA